MTSPSSVLSPRAVQVHTFLLVVCGVGLLLSIPPITRVARLLEPHWNPPWQTFFATYVATTALIGLSRGSSAAAVSPLRWSVILSLLVHTAFGQMLVLPMLVFSRSLAPGKDVGLLLLLLYSTCSAMMFSLIALRMELWGVARRTRPFFLQYMLFGLFVVAPWVLSFVERIPAIVAVFSPIGAALQIMQSASSAEIAVAFGFVLLMISIQLLGIRRQIRRPHAV